MKTLLRIGFWAALGGLFFWILNRAAQKQALAADGPHFPHVRDAGPDFQEGIDADDWDLVDEQSDESFPASDPPGNY